MADADLRPDANRLIAYHSPIALALTTERTSLESRLIPVSAYVVTACVEAYLRYPDLVAAIDAALPADEIGRRARHPGCRVNTVHLWGVPNFHLLGRKVFAMLGPSASDPVERTAPVLRFWERAATAFRADGTLQAWDTGDAPVYPEPVVAELLAGVRPIDADERAIVKRFNATLVTYLFLLYFDTRVGTGDTGPYPLPDGRQLLVRDYYEIGPSDFWWSTVAASLPFRNLTAAFVLDGARVTRLTDFGTSYTDPEDYLDHVAAFGLYTTDGGGLTPVGLDQLDALVATVREVQRDLYRRVAAMDRHEKIRCGAFVYFAFLKRFAEMAGCADHLDWTVPRDIPPALYELVAAMDGANEPPDPTVEYYDPFP
ncbi:MAG TPA: hypothetical protein VKD67_12305 [Acidimicrobiales bacterium]|nr:hypothetical protein [Acidimicrobiales bacterium]